MAKGPNVIGIITEPPPPTWWKANRHKVFGVGGLLIGYLVGTYLGGPQQPETPRPGRTTHAPHSTHTAHGLAA